MVVGMMIGWPRSRIDKGDKMPEAFSLLALPLIYPALEVIVCSW